MQVELLQETWVETPLLTTAGCKRIHEIKERYPRKNKAFQGVHYVWWPRHLHS